jgi:hypothetical protein
MVIEQEIVTLISQVGFPIAITMWFMLRTEKVITNNTDIMGEIKTLMVNCKK